MRAGCIVLGVALGMGLSGPRALAGDEADRGHRVEELARALESPEAAARAKAAGELGTMFPEGAAAVPVLIDAVEDEDPAVRAASIAALRRLGRAGLEAVAAQLGHLPAETTTTM